jgi:hypothetical protein
MQKDIAFKIMYFLISFVFAAFGLLFIYFKILKKAKADVARSRTGHLDHKVGKFSNLREKNDTFFDFLAGKMNQDQFVYPNDSRNISAAMKEVQFSKKQELRGDSGFGAGDLEQLVSNN